MTTYYVDSAAGSNTSPYDTWAKAATALSTIAAIDAAGDIIYVASTHAETTSSAISLSWAGTPTSPTRIICADKTSGAPPATLATGGSVTCSSVSNTISINATNTHVYVYGLTWISAATAGSSVINCGNGSYLEQCSFQFTGASGTAGVVPQSSVWKNCSVKFAASGQGINATGSTGWRCNGLVLLSGGTSPSALFVTTGPIVVEPISGVDLTNASASVNIVALSASLHLFRLVKAKLPASWSGALNAANPSVGSFAELINSGNAAENYDYHRQTRFGDITHETTLVRTGGSSDGTTPVSRKLVSLAASGLFPLGALVGAEREIWNDTVGSSVTLTVEFLHDSVTGLKDNEIWIDVRYPKNTGDPLGEVASSAMANVLATPATLTSSSETWTTTGMSNPNKQKMSVSFTPQMKGPLYWTPYLAKASYTAYVDLKAALS